MRPDDIFEFTRRQPFLPFRLTTTGGETFEIWHPEFAMVGKSTVAFGVIADDRGKVAERIGMLALVHIVKIEFLDVAKSSSQNGHK